MIYRSNLSAPDLQTCFRHVASRPMPHSQGHDVTTHFSDKADDDPVFGIYKQCGFWTHDEAAILYNVANKIMVYRTRHGVVLFYHDPFVPPEHMPDPNIQEVAL